MPVHGYSTSSKRAYAVRISPVIGYVVSLSGGEVKLPRAKMWNGGAAVPDLIIGRREIGDLTCTVLYRPRTYGPMTKELLHLMAIQAYTITKQDTDDNGQSVGRPLVYTGCRMSQLTPPDYDEQSDTNGSLLSMMFVVSGIA